MNRKIGFIGLGIMGKPMAKNLLKAGFPLVVYNRRKAPVEELIREKAISANSPKEVGERSEVIITMLLDSPEVKEVILGKEGLIHGIQEGSVVIDMSSINPLVTKEIARKLKEKGVEMLDAPVSGGEIGAIQGTLAIMVGGEEKVFKSCMEIFNALGKSIVYVGPIGSGGYVKLVNQIIVALNIATLGEAFCLGLKAGLDPQVIYQAIRAGLAGSQVMETKIPMILQRNFKPGFKIRLHQKDIQNALSTAKDLGLPMFLTSFVQQVLTSLIQEGKGEEDHSAIVTFFEKISGIQIRSTPQG